MIKIKRIERVTPNQRAVLDEIRRNPSKIAINLHPNSPLMKKVREDREQADRKLAERGVIVIL